MENPRLENKLARKSIFLGATYDFIGHFTLAPFRDELEELRCVIAETQQLQDIPHWTKSSELPISSQSQFSATYLEGIKAKEANKLARLVDIWYKYNSKRQDVEKNAPVFLGDGAIKAKSHVTQKLRGMQRDYTNAVKKYQTDVSRSDSKTPDMNIHLGASSQFEDALPKARWASGDQGRLEEPYPNLISNTTLEDTETVVRSNCIKLNVYTT